MLVETTVYARLAAAETVHHIAPPRPPGSRSLELLTLVLVVFCGLALLGAVEMARARRIRIRHPRPGTLYVVQDLAQPNLFKVGITHRTAKARRAEIRRTMAEGELREILRAEIPHVRDVEREAHRRLRRRQARLPGRGQEWFRADGHAAILAEVSLAIRDVRRHARRWRSDAPIRVYLHGRPLSPDALLDGRFSEAGPT